MQGRLQTQESKQESSNNSWQVIFCPKIVVLQSAAGVRNHGRPHTKVSISSKVGYLEDGVYEQNIFFRFVLFCLYLYSLAKAK